MRHSTEHKKIYSKVYQRALAILRDKYIEEYNSIEGTYSVRKARIAQNHKKEFSVVLLDVKCNRV